MLFDKFRNLFQVVRNRHIQIILFNYFLGCNTKDDLFGLVKSFIINFMRLN